MPFLVIDGLQVPVALNQSGRSDRVTAGEITDMFDGSLQSSARGLARVWEIPTHPLPLASARALEGVASGLRRVQVWGDAIDTDSTAPVEAFVRLERLRLGHYADGARRAFVVSVTEAEPIRKVLNWESGFPSVGTFSRASTARYRDRYGILQSAAVDEARTGHYVEDVSGLMVPGWLLELARTNLVLQPTNFSAWAVSGTPVLASGQSDPADGTSAYLIEDNDAAGFEYIRISPMFTGTAVKAISVFAKAGSSANSEVLLRDTTAGTTRLRAAIAWSGGVPTVTMHTGTQAEGPQALTGGWYRFLFTSTSVTPANTNELRLYPAASDVASATGSTYFYHAQAENGASPTSPVDGTRAVEVASRAMPAGTESPRDAWTRSTRWKAGVTGAGGLTDARITQVGNGTLAGAAHLRVYLDTTTGSIRLAHRNTAGATDAVDSGVVPARGQVMDALTIWYGNGTGRLIVSADGGTPTSVSLAGTATPASAWNGGGTAYVNSREGGSDAGAMTLLRDYFLPRALTGSAEPLLNFARHL